MDLIGLNEKGRLKCLRRGNVLGYVWSKEIMLKGLYKWEDKGDYRLLNGNYFVKCICAFCVI